MTRKIIAVAAVMAVLGLIGSGAMVYGQAHGFPMPGDLGLIPDIRPPEVNLPGAVMSAYERFGLSYSIERGGYCYNGKLIGLFVDTRGRGISYLNQVNGEVNVRAVRDNSGNLTGLAELSAEEYSEIVSGMDSLRAEIEGRLGSLPRISLPEIKPPEVRLPEIRPPEIRPPEVRLPGADMSAYERFGH